MSILGFFGENRYLSNFWRCDVVYEEETYPTVEHAYQAAKTIDPLERKRIQLLSSPGDAKKAGRSVTLRKDWECVKLDIMKELVKYKFTHNPKLKEKLLSTKDLYLEETNTWRDFWWGKCNGKGENHLGRIIMEVRTELQKEGE